MRAAWLLVVAGCSTSFDPASYVNKLRVLAIHAEPPEIAAGATATLSAFLVGGSGDGGAPAMHWTACTRPPTTGSGESVNPDCLGTAPADYLIPVGDGPTATVTMPAGSPFDRGLPDATFGFYLPVILRVTDGSNAITAVYRLRETVLNPLTGMPAQPPNHNPTLDKIYVVPPAPDGGSEPDAGVASLMVLDSAAPPTVHAGEKITLRATVTGDSFEPYPIIVGDLKSMNIMQVTELMKISWFTSAGSFSEETTGDQITGEPKPNTTLTLDAKHTPTAPATVDVYVVVRDDRGGIDFTTRSFLLR